jgi:hypothetical protein
MTHFNNVLFTIVIYLSILLYYYNSHVVNIENRKVHHRISTVLGIVENWEQNFFQKKILASKILFDIITIKPYQKKIFATIFLYYRRKKITMKFRFFVRFA